jgi:hypothetical protein
VSHTATLSIGVGVTHCGGVGARVKKPGRSSDLREALLPGRVGGAAGGLPVVGPDGTAEAIGVALVGEVVPARVEHALRADHP